MPKVELPLVTPLEQRTNDITKDAKMVNCYKETIAGRPHLVKRPGKATYTITPALSPRGQGLWVYNNNLYAVANGTLYQITGGTAIAKGTGLDVSCDNVSFANTAATSSPHPYMVVHDKVNGYYLDATGSWVLINGQIQEVVINTGGLGYPTSGTFTVSGTTGSGAAGTYIATALGTITSVTLTSRGTNYTGPLTVTFSGTPSSPATASAVVNSFPTNPVSGLPYLDGYVFCMDTRGTIWQSDEEDPTSWNSLNYITANAEPDQGVGLVKHLNYLVAFKQWTTEFYYDNANPVGSVLACNPTATLEIGCASGDSIQSFEEIVVWMANNKEGGRTINLLNGQVPTVISNKAIENFLNASDLSTVYSWVYKISGHTFYGLVLADQDVTMVYDLAEKEWHFWTTSKQFIGGGEGYFECTFVQTFPANTKNTYVLDAVTGNVYTIGVGNYKDPFGPITVRLVTARGRFGTSTQKSNSELAIFGDNINDTINVRHTNDDYDTWSAYRQVDLSLQKPILYNLGRFRRRAYEFLYTGFQPLRLDVCELKLSGEPPTE